MTETKCDQETVAFLGPEASYTHQATLSRFPNSDHSLLPQTTIEDVFASVHSGSASCGVVPFENSSNGSVLFTLDLFADVHGQYPDVAVYGEIYLPVRLCLVGRVREEDDVDVTFNSTHGEESNSATLRPSNATPSTSASMVPPYDSKPEAPPRHPLTHLRKLYSHPQAWTQCDIFLQTYCVGIKREDASSTSDAAARVAQDSSGCSAALTSRLAAEVHGLDILAEGIEDRQGNCTRFFVLRRRTRGRSEEGRNSSATATTTAVEVGRDGEVGFKSLVTFTLEHGEPGALADCLAVFKRHGLNLTSINTRPSGEGPWHYIFFVEFVGMKREEEEGGAVNEALRDLGQVAKSSRWLGSWENMLPRQ